MLGMKIDYDGIASSYDQRYAKRRYAGIERMLREFVERGCSLLEVGCGTGHWLRLLQSGGCQVTGLDASVEMLHVAAAKLRSAPLLQGTAAVLPFRNRSFDRLIMVNVLHHLSSPAICLREANRVLRPGGRFVSFGLDPSTERDQWYVYDYFDGVREADRRRYPACPSISEWLQAAGFANVETSVAEHIAESVDAREYIERGSAARDSTSQLALLSDREYQAGMDRIWADVRGARERGTSLQLRADLRIYATTGTVST
jgi:ubiquinone/menaquinone biosynthesis C-methylase UbiE